jgi:SNF2 family DNA or RNA helicase
MVKPLNGDWFRLKEPGEIEVALANNYPGAQVYTNRLGQIEAVTVHRNLLPLFGSSAPRLSSTGARGPFSPPFKLRDYQKEAVSFARERAGSCLFHDLGMGKTAMALAAAELPCLVVAPNTAMYGWESAAKEAGASVKVLRGRSQGRLDELRQGHDMFIVSYTSAPQWIPYFRNMGAGVQLHTIIADEVHMLHRKNLSWSNAFRAISRQRTIGLTATPLRNRMSSLWGVLDAMTPRAWGLRHEFLERYAGATRGDFGGWDLGYLTEVGELVARLGEVAIRRSLSEPEFVKLRPPLIRECIEVPMSSKEKSALFSCAAKGSISQYNRGGINPTTLKFLTRERFLIGQAKTAWLENHIHEFESRMCREGRSLWWFWHRELADRFASFVQKTFSVPVDSIHGSTSPAARAHILREWERGNPKDHRVLVGTIGALNAAANLLTCRAAYFVELDWSPINIVQAEKRHHRPGNVHSECLVTYFTVPGTIDEVIATKLLVKVEEAEDLFGASGQVAQMTALLGNDLDHIDNILEV